jgi:hypothetical protein
VTNPRFGDALIPEMSNYTFHTLATIPLTQFARPHENCQKRIKNGTELAGIRTNTRKGERK